MIALNSHQNVGIDNRDVNVCVSDNTNGRSTYPPAYSSHSGSGVRPSPFLFYPHPFYKGTLDTENSGPHPFSNLYVSYIHFWCHGNVVD